MRRSPRPSRRLLRLLGCLLLLALSSRSSTAQTVQSRLLVRDITPGPRGTDFMQPTVVGQQTFFLTFKPAPLHGHDLWVTDTTFDGTRRITELIAPAADVQFAALIALDGRLLVEVTINGQLQLWQSDGTAAGTRLIAAVEGTRFTGAMVVLAGAAYGFTTDAAPGSDEIVFHLWRSAGTAATTQRIVTTQPYPQNTLVHPLVAGQHLYALWTKDFSSWYPSREYAALAGSQFTTLAACTDQFTDMPCMTYGVWDTQFVVAQQQPTRLLLAAGTTTRTLDLGMLPIRFITLMGQLGATLIFTAVNAANEDWLWRSDGTLAGTQALHRFDEVSTFHWFTEAQGLLYFYEFRHTIVQSPMRLWQTDGTAAGTRQFAGPGGRYGTLKIPTMWHSVVKDRLIFVANDGVHGDELWQIASRDAAPTLLVDLVPGNSLSQVTQIFPLVPNGMVWIAWDEAVGQELYYLPHFAPYVRPAWGGGPTGGLATAPVRFGNDGPDSQPVTVTLTLPDGVSLVRQTLGTHPITTTGTVQWRLAELPTGERQALLTVQLPAAPVGSVFTGTLRLEPGGSAPIRFQIAQQLYLDRVGVVAPSRMEGGAPER